MVSRTASVQVYTGYRGQRRHDDGGGLSRGLAGAAEELGESPTKAQYEELGLTPASATIMKTLGGWNTAKELAGLKTFDRGATGDNRIQPKPNNLDLPADLDWKELTSQQRWYYKNRKKTY